jgi:glycosyltransferase involved in cell wall biosynthesis
MKSDISVLVRAHLDAPFLDEAVASVLNQKFNGNFEILLSLDRPTLKLTNYAIQASRNPKIRVIESTTPGIANRLNDLMLASGSKYVAILDSDDVMLANRLQEQWDFLESNLNISVVGSNIIIINHIGNQIGVKYFHPNPETIRKFRFKNLPVAHPAVLMRRQEIILLGGYREFYSHSEDYDLWLRVLETSSIANITKFLTAYRTHPDQITSANSHKHYAAALAARTSAKRRDKGKNDLAEDFASAIEWSNSPKIRLEIFKRINRRKLLAVGKYQLDSRMWLQVAFIGIRLMLLGPKSGYFEIKYALARRKSAS